MSYIDRLEEPKIGYKAFFSFYPTFIGKFCKAISMSEAREHKIEKFTIDDFEYTYNKLKTIEMNYANDGKYPTIYPLLASIANVQIYHQDYNPIRVINRQVRIYKLIPEIFGLKSDKNWIDILSLFEDEYQDNFVSITTKCYDLFNHQMKYNRQFYYELTKLPKYSEYPVETTIDYFNKYININNDAYYCIVKHSHNQSYLDFSDIERSDFPFKTITQSMKTLHQHIIGKSPELILSDWQPLRTEPLVNIKKDRFIIPSAFDFAQAIISIVPNFLNNLEQTLKKRYTQIWVFHTRNTFFIISLRNSLVC